MCPGGAGGSIVAVRVVLAPCPAPTPSPLRAPRTANHVHLIFVSKHSYLNSHPQYLSAWSDAALLLGVPLAAVGAVCWLLTASCWGTALLLAVLSSLLVHLMGAMLLAGGWLGFRVCGFRVWASLG